MPVLVTRTKVKAEHTTEVENAAARLFGAIHLAHPANIRCTSSKLSDGQTFLTVLHVEEGTENPLPSIPAYQEFLATLRRCVAEPPIAEQVTVIGSYRFF